MATFGELIENLKQYGIAVEDGGEGRKRVSRGTAPFAIAATVTPGGAEPGAKPAVSKAGLVIGQEIGALVNGGYQQYWLTPAKKRVPAQAQHLRDLHAFEEDLKEALGLDSLYNTSLGTTSALHLYDRVEKRDSDRPAVRPWEKHTARG